MKNLVPGTYINCRLLGMPPEEGDVYERRMRSISTDTAAGAGAGTGDDKTKLRSVKRFLSRVDHTGATTVPRARLLYVVITDVTCQVRISSCNTRCESLVMVFTAAKYFDLDFGSVFFFSFSSAVSVQFFA